jgi:hypothetical protein
MEEAMRRVSAPVRAENRSPTDGAAQARQNRGGDARLSEEFRLKPE